MRAFACSRQGRTGAAWNEYRGDDEYALRVSLRPDGAKTAEVVRGMYDDGGVTDVALGHPSLDEVFLALTGHPADEPLTTEDAA